MDNYNQDRQKSKFIDRRSAKDRRVADDNMLINTDRRSGIDRRKANQLQENKKETGE